jgi:hypothetical protein
VIPESGVDADELSDSEAGVEVSSGHDEECERESLLMKSRFAITLLLR